MTDDEIMALATRHLRKRGLQVKEWSVPYILGKARGTGEPTADAIGQRLDALAEKESIHFAPLDGELTPNARERAVKDLERVNEHAHATRPNQKPVRMKLTPRQRAWIAKHGAEAALDLANGGPPIEFEDESNVEI